MERILTLSRKIDSIVEYLTPLLPFANSHMVEYITKDQWNTFIPAQIIKEVEQNGYEKTIEAFWQINRDIAKGSENQSSTNDKSLFEHFSKFIIDANTHRIKNDDACFTLDTFKEKFNSKGVVFQDSLKIFEFMSDKKSHEVEVLSGVLASLHKWSDATHIVDLGGGKGYLSSMLTTLFKIPVLNIDYSKINAKGAADRNKKLDRYWPAILKKAHDLKLNESISKQDDNNDAYKSHDFENSDKIGHLYRHVVKYVTSDTDLIGLIDESFNIENKLNNTKLSLTGLHTCGSLGSTVLKLFIKNSDASVLCVIPCCYNLMTECKEENTLYEMPEHTQNDTQSDFPMSSYLKGFCIGRNARMMAAQALERVIGFKDLPSKSLFYRALLQVLLAGKIDTEGSLRKLGVKCTSFADYVKNAAKKRNFDCNLMNFDEKHLNDLETSHKHHNDRMIIFYLLRMCLGPVVESLILLDKLMYLHENGFNGELGEAYLVRMFDPVLSPRCHSLIAYRKRN